MQGPPVWWLVLVLGIVGYYLLVRAEFRSRLLLPAAAMVAVLVWYWLTFELLAFYAAFALGIVMVGMQVLGSGVRADREEQRAGAELLGPTEKERPWSPVKLWARGFGTWRDLGPSWSGQVAGRRVLVTELSWGVGDRDDGPEEAWTVVAVVLPSGVSAVSIRPELPRTRLLRALGIRDRDLEIERFNRRFDLTCEDPRAAVALLAPHVVDNLLEPPNDASVSLAGEELLCWLPRRGGQELAAIVRNLVAAVEAIPSAVFEIADPSPPTS